MLSPDENEQLVEYVSELLAMAAMTMYTQSPLTHEHKHRQIGSQVLCVHEYVHEPTGRTVRLFVNAATPRSLTMSVTVGDDEPVLHSPPLDFQAIHNKAVVDTLEHIFALPEAEDPQE